MKSFDFLRRLRWEEIIKEQKKKMKKQTNRHVSALLLHHSNVEKMETLEYQGIVGEEEHR